jgi:hypothetical protein
MNENIVHLQAEPKKDQSFLRQIGAITALENKTKSKDQRAAILLQSSAPPHSESPHFSHKPKTLKG